jgi:hypothetical protein
MRVASLFMLVIIGCCGSAEPTIAAAPAAASDWHATIRDFAAKHFRNPAWGYSHCLRDYALARELAAADHVALLKGTGFPMAKIDAVRGAIRTHMYYRDPVGPEALYLHDADALDWLGAIGAARVMALVDLKDVPGRVLSPAGRARVAPRKAELEGFLRDLRRESDNLRTL